MQKFSLFPITKFNFWEMYKKQQKAIWSVEEIDFSGDYKNFILLDIHQQNTIKKILSFFSNSDGLVNFNIKNNFLNSFSDEITYTYVFQMFMENIHNETYGMMIDTLIKDDDEKEDLFNSLNTNPTINKISQWGLNYSNGPYTLAEKILVFICFEGIMFSGAFALIFWIKSICADKVMSGLTKSNELISRDESMHVEFGIELFKEQNLMDKLDNTTITRIIKECVELTKQFNTDVLQIKQTGMNESLMNKYTEYVADRIFVELGLLKNYNASNPFAFMTTIGMTQKTNFHESRPTEYQKPPLGNTVFNIDDENF